MSSVPPFFRRKAAAPSAKEKGSLRGTGVGMGVAANGMPGGGGERDAGEEECVAPLSSVPPPVLHESRTSKCLRRVWPSEEFSR